MLRNIKKINNILLVFVLLFVFLIVPEKKVEAKTLGDLKSELATKKAEYQKNQEQKSLTENKMNDIKTTVGTIYNKIEQNQNTIVELSNKIVELKDNIEKKQEEIKEIIKFYQLSQGESSYLEYAFGAADFTDFIYRLAVSEQLTSYNKQLIAEQNQMIEESKKTQENLKSQETELTAKQAELNTQLDSLGSQLSEIVDLRVDIAEEIKTQEAAINLYEKQYNCKDGDEISVCTASRLPADTSFWRPIVKGHLSSEYGYRTYRLNGKIVSDFHTGVDLTVSPNDNVPVYAAAAGKVIGIVNKASCGGNKIYIHHNINGKTYTTAYVHLRRILVSVGDTVTKDTQIAVMGGNPSIETWDSCSTGSHLHFMVASGLYLKDYSSWNTFVSRTINPRNIINIPSGENYFYNRTTKY